MKKSPYAGYPTPEGDAAWRELLHNSNIRISGEELKKLNRSSIQLQDGSGDFFGGLSAHHHLHCIKSVRRVLYRDYYGLPEEDWMWSHLGKLHSLFLYLIVESIKTDIFFYKKTIASKTSAKQCNATQILAS